MAHQARLNRPDPNIEKQAKEAKESEAQTAYSEWLDMKRKQDKALRQLEESRRAEEASQYAIRDRQVCDEAFRRWASYSETSKCQQAPSQKMATRLYHSHFLFVPATTQHGIY